MDGTTSYDLVFDVNGSFSISDLGPSTVTVTAFNEDNNNGVEQNDSEEFTLTIAKEFTGAPGTPAVITDFYQDIDNDGTRDHNNDVVANTMTDTDAYQNSKVIEDTQFSLSDVVHVEIVDTNNGNNAFSITLKNVPTGVDIQGMTFNPQDGGFYTLSGNGNPQAVIDALTAIKVTPTKDMNTDAGNISGTDLNFDIELTTYATGAESNISLINFTASVLPVTDEMDLTVVNSGSTNEDTAHIFSITLDNEADGAKTTIIDGKVYLKLTEDYTDDVGTDGASGTLSVDNKTMKVENIDIGDGAQNYYVIEDVSYNDKLDFTYTPATNRDGTITVDTYVNNKETETWTTHETDTLTSHKQFEFNVNSVIDGFTLGGSEISGTEDVLVPVGITLTSTDSSEKLSSVSLGGLADGFLLYYGAASDGSGKSLANNLGTDGTTTMQMTYGVDETVDTNRWNIPLTDGNLPAYIWIATPENWSGTIPNLSVNAVDIYGNIFDETITSGTIAPVVDSLTLNATKTFGNEGEDILLNLNANVEDLDGSETVTLTLSGFGDAEATFKANGEAIAHTYDGDTYTIEGIDVNDINALTVSHGAMSSTTITTTAKMIETVGNTSTDIQTDDFLISISQSLASSGNDTLLLEAGISFDGLDGTDTLVLNGVTLDPSEISNIEILDLEAGNNSISLTLDDVLDMTDDDNELKILGDSADSVNFTGTGWSSTAEESGFDIYTYSTDTTVQVKVQTEIFDGITSLFKK